MHPTIPAETVLRHLTEQAERDRRLPSPRRPVTRGHRPVARAAF
jgi:hypothetical protein